MFISHELLLLDRHSDSSLCMVDIDRSPHRLLPVLPPLLRMLPLLLLVPPPLLTALPPQPTLRLPAQLTLGMPAQLTAQLTLRAP